MQVLNNFRSRCLNPLNLATAKAGFLSLLMVFAGTPNLRAELQCADPVEYNCTFSFGGGQPCGGGTYTLYLKDSTPGSTIFVQVWADEAPVGNTQVSGDGSQTVIVNVNAYSEGGYGCYWPTLTGTMYAYATGYSNSNTVDLSF